eukprot:gnl/TRDRNA2_/TRDRNA2_92111_c0_seq2.p1 gnl/TRDRNA2_/TRDRNA2_92111_c0~~gnl/TRDRNA2_/TRDRNA2_92111_c0_seq2.p1  ORF type:complete len:349 (-),score=34.60 gnl/TRDRNA2_/TRDRNA2_92111_c0_seq2:83-1129(-)
MQSSSTNAPAALFMVVLVAEMTAAGVGGSRTHEFLVGPPDLRTGGSTKLVERRLLPLSPGARLDASMLGKATKVVSNRDNKPSAQHVVDKRKVSENAACRYASMSVESLKRLALEMDIPSSELQKGARRSTEKQRAFLITLIQSHKQKGLRGILSDGRVHAKQATRKVSIVLCNGCSHLKTSASRFCGALQRHLRQKKIRLPTWLCHVGYMLTCVNPFLSVCFNRYTGVCFYRPLVEHRKKHPPPTIPSQVYSLFFYFARLRPRLLFAIGACLRGLQQTTLLQLLFDPRVGVGLGCNLLALMTGSSWPAPFVLGWALSQPVWAILHAEPPPRKINVPVQIGLRPFASV